MRRILLIKLTRMGDILEAQPLLRNIRQNEPSARISMLVNETFRGAAELLPEVDEILSFPLFDLVHDIREANGDLVDHFVRLEAFATLLSSVSYDLVLNLTNSRLSGILMGMMKARQKRGLLIGNFGQREVVGVLIRYFGANEAMRGFSPFNLSDFMRGLYGELRVPPPSTLRMEDAARQQARSLLGEAGPETTWVGIQLGASEACKRWRIDHFAEAASSLLQLTGTRSVRLVLLGTAEEQPLAERFLQLLPADAPVMDLVGKTGLQTLAAVVSHLSLLISNDTGTMHMAACLEVRVLNLSLGSAWFRETAPWGEGHLVLEPRIECRPCDFTFVCDHFSCKRLIDPQSVARIAAAMLDGDQGLADAMSGIETFDVYRLGFGSEGLLLPTRLTHRALSWDDVLLHVFRAGILQCELGGDETLRQEEALAHLLLEGQRLAEGVLPALQASLARFDWLEARAAVGVRLMLDAIDAIDFSQAQRVQSCLEEANALDRELLGVARLHADARLLMRTLILAKEAVQSPHMEGYLRGELGCYMYLRAAAAMSAKTLRAALLRLEAAGGLSQHEW